MDERTVAKVLLGKPVRGEAGRKIREVLRARGIELSNVPVVVEEPPCP